jgi:hypothetical protein
VFTWEGATHHLMSVGRDLAFVTKRHSEIHRTITAATTNPATKDPMKIAVPRVPIGSGSTSIPRPKHVDPGSA